MRTGMKKYCLKGKFFIAMMNFYVPSKSMGKRPTSDLAHEIPLDARTLTSIGINSPKSGLDLFVKLANERGICLRLDLDNGGRVIN